jgi:hypothetical protein
MFWLSAALLLTLSTRQQLVQSNWILLKQLMMRMISLVVADKEASVFLTLQSRRTTLLGRKASLTLG